MFLIPSAAKRASRIEASGFYDNPSTHPSSGRAGAREKESARSRLFLSITLFPRPVEIISFTCFCGAQSVQPRTPSIVIVSPQHTVTSPAAWIPSLFWTFRMAASPRKKAALEHLHYRASAPSVPLHLLIALLTAYVSVFHAAREEAKRENGHADRSKGMPTMNRQS